MRLFQCQHCRALLYFESSQCVSCGRSLGFLAARQLLSALEPDGWAFRALAEPKTRSFRYCANAQHGVCNWLLPPTSPSFIAPPAATTAPSPTCRSPDNAAALAQDRSRQAPAVLHAAEIAPAACNQGGGSRWARLRFHRRPDRRARPHPGDDRASSGLITINIAEADDVERERRRSQMGEPYRTLLGHFRHEIAHYYWDRLIASTPSLDGFREIFGDEQQDYVAALQQHYAGGPPATGRSVSSRAYAVPIRGRISPRPGRTTSTWSIRWRRRAHSA